MESVNSCVTATWSGGSTGSASPRVEPEHFYIGCDSAGPSPVRPRKYEVLYFQTFGSRGETVLDPVVAELLVHVKVLKLKIRLTPSRHPVSRRFGLLPVLVATAGSKSRGSEAAETISRDNLIATVAKRAGDNAAMEDVSPGMHGEVWATVQLQSAMEDDEAYCSLLRRVIGRAVQYLLWHDIGIYEDYTRPVVRASVPYGLGVFSAWLDRQLHCSGSGALREGEQAFMQLPAALESLSARLGEADFFTKTANAPLSPLDACAFGHLSVLFSIPCEPGSRLYVLLNRFNNLAGLCKRVQALHNVWPSVWTFLLALPEEDRPSGLPLAASAGLACGEDESDDRRERQRQSDFRWWQYWGWSSSPRRPLVQRNEAVAPLWMMMAFGVAAVVPAAFAVAFADFGPAFLAPLRAKNWLKNQAAR